jgi:hypothetical protein
MQGVIVDSPVLSVHMTEASPKIRVMIIDEYPFTHMYAKTVNSTENMVCVGTIQNKYGWGDLNHPLPLVLELSPDVIFINCFGKMIMLASPLIREIHEAKPDIGFVLLNTWYFDIEAYGADYIEREKPWSNARVIRLDESLTSTRIVQAIRDVYHRQT